MHLRLAAAALAGVFDPSLWLASQGREKKGKESKKTTTERSFVTLEIYHHTPSNFRYRSTFLMN